jgi:hypothetical protein
VRPRTVLLATACLIGGLAILSVPPQMDAVASDETPEQERLVVFELFNRSQSGG